jgi:hypothetical protein
VNQADTNSSYPPFHPARSDLPLVLDPKEFKREFREESKYVAFKTGLSRNQLQETVVSFSNAEGA